MCNFRPFFISTYRSLYGVCDEVQDVCLLNKSLADLFKKTLSLPLLSWEKKRGKMLATRTFIDVRNNVKI